MQMHDQHDDLRRIEAYLILAGRTDTSSGQVDCVGHTQGHGVIAPTPIGTHALLPTAKGWRHYEDAPYIAGKEWIDHGVIARCDDSPQEVADRFDDAILGDDEQDDDLTPTQTLHNTVVAALEAAAAGDLDRVTDSEMHAMADAITHRLTRHTHLPARCEAAGISRTQRRGEPALNTMLRELAAALDERGYTPHAVDHRDSRTGEIRLNTGHIGLTETTSAASEATRWALYARDTQLRWTPGICPPCAMVDALAASGLINQDDPWAPAQPISPTHTEIDPPTKSCWHCDAEMPADLDRCGFCHYYQRSH